MTRKGSKRAKARKGHGRERASDGRRTEAGAVDAPAEVEGRADPGAVEAPVELEASADRVEEAPVEVEAPADPRAMEGAREMPAGQADEEAVEVVEDLDAVEDVDAEEVLREIEALVAGRDEDPGSREGAGPAVGAPEGDAGAAERALEAAAHGDAVDSAQDAVAGGAADAADEDATRPGGRLVGRPGAADPELQKPSRPEDRERLVAQALAHAEAQDARYWRPRPPATGRWKLPLALAVFCLAGYVAAAPPEWARPVSVASSISQRQHERGVRMALQLQAQEIEAFRALHQRLPSSLGELPVRMAGVRWIRSSSRVYQLVATTPDGKAIVYDSARPAAEFRATRREIAALSRMNPLGEP